MIGKLFVCLSIALMLTGCGSEPTPKPEAKEIHSSGTPQTTPSGFEAAVSVPEFVNQMPFLEGTERAALRKAWDKLPNHDNYRAARSLGSKNVIHDYGEIAGAYGLALFVIDSTRTVQRHGLVVILRRSSNRYDAYWIYHDQELANFSMSRSSGSIFIKHGPDDNSKTNCRLEWVRAKGKWTCESLRQL